MKIDRRQAYLVYLKSSHIVSLIFDRSDVSERLSEKNKLAADALFSPFAFRRLIYEWACEQEPLVEAICLATTFHVLLFPVLWSAGWILPFPKPPVTTTVIYLDLSNWGKVIKPPKVIKYRDPDLN